METKLEPVPAAPPPEKPTRPARPRPLAGLLSENPVLRKEIRVRMRGARAYWLLGIYVIILAVVVALIYMFHQAFGANAIGMPGSVGDSSRVLGRRIFTNLLLVQSILVAMIAPALTAGSITIEREQRAYDLLVTSPLRASDVIRGKLLAALSFALLLLTASLPLLSLSFLVGGVSPGEIFFNYLLIVLSAFLYASIGIFWSASLRSTAGATVLTYVSVMTLFVLFLVPGFTAMSMGGWMGVVVPSIPFQSLNPLMGPWRALEAEHLLTALIPSWIGSATMLLLGGLLTAVLAMDRLEHFRPPNPIYARLLTLALWLFGMLFFLGAWIGGTATGWTGAREANGAAVYILGVTLVLLTLLIPIFNTGDVVLRRGENAVARYFTGLLPHRLLASEVPSGLPLMLLLFLLPALLTPLGAHLAGASLPHAQAYLPALALGLCVVWGLSGLAQLLGVLLPHRPAACVLTYFAALAITTLPQFTLVGWYRYDRPPQVLTFLSQSLYFSPVEGFLRLTLNAREASARPSLWLDRFLPVWSVTAGFYLLLGLVCLAATAWCIRRHTLRLEKIRAQQDAPHGARGAAGEAPGFMTKSIREGTKDATT
jgi:ABC-type transport system involved in multi-copper enzyme maturation permease subunit